MEIKQSCDILVFLKSESLFEQDLINRMLTIDSKRRINSSDALKHPWIAVRIPLFISVLIKRLANYEMHCKESSDWRPG